MTSVSVFTKTHTKRGIRLVIAFVVSPHMFCWLLVPDGQAVHSAELIPELNVFPGQTSHAPFLFAFRNDPTGQTEMTKI